MLTVLGHFAAQRLAAKGAASFLARELLKKVERAFIVEGGVWGEDYLRETPQR